MNPIKRARLCRGMTQTELAKHLGVSPVTVCKWEHGEALPNPKRLPLMAEVLHTKTSDLIVEERVV